MLLLNTTIFYFVNLISNLDPEPFIVKLPNCPFFFNKRNDTGIVRYRSLFLIVVIMRHAPHLLLTDMGMTSWRRVFNSNYILIQRTKSIVFAYYDY